MTLKESSSFFLDTFTKKICKDVTSKINSIFEVQISTQELSKMFTRPPDKLCGHWALPCFFLSKKLKQSPIKIAQKLAESYPDSPIFQNTENKGAYVNFFFHKKFLKSYLLDFLYLGESFKLPAKKIGSWLIEYSQPNTHKELHIGHMRNLCFGLALSTFLKKRAFPIISCTYPGDVGTHVAKCLWYLKYHNTESIPLHHKGQWLGTIYTLAYQKYENTTDIKQQEKNKKQITEILQQLKNKEGPFYILWKETRAWSKTLMDEVYQWMGAKFDHWYWESEIDKASVQWINTLYKNKKLQLSKSAIGLNLGEPLGFCLLLKSDGNGLYSTKDLYLSIQKFKDHKPSKNIYIVDQRQETHFKQIFKVLEQIGFTEEAQKSKHLKYNFVELKTGAMSSRSGNIIPIMKLIQNMSHYIETQFLTKYINIWSKKKIKHTSYIISQGAIKYGMNEQDLNKKIVFDMSEWLKLDGRSGPYIQYAHARACSLLKKFQLSTNTSINIEALNSPEEWDLILHLSWFSLTMEKSAWQMKTSPICHYLFELAQIFSRFYQNCPISTLNNEEQKQFRLFLVQIVKKVLAQGLDYLTIPAPEQM